MGARKVKKSLGFKLEVVKNPGALWRNKKVEEVVAMLSEKTKLLNRLVTRLLRDGRRISPLVVELLCIVGGDSSAEALSEVHARTEFPVISFDPKAPNLNRWQNKVLAYVTASEDLASGLIAGLESLASLITAKQVSEVERLALARVRSDLEKLVESTSGEVKTDVNMVAETISVAGGMDQSDDVVSQSASEEGNGNAPMDLSMPKSVELSTPPVQGMDMELIGQARVPPIFTSVILANPNRLARHVETMEVFMDAADGVVPYLSENVQDIATPMDGPGGAGQDGFSFQNFAPQERSMESDIQFNNLPVVSSNLLSESPVGIPQYEFAVEVEQLSEPGSSRHVTQFQQEELLAHTNTFLNGFEDAQKSGTPNMSESPRVPIFASLGKAHPQDVKVRRNSNRTVRRSVPQGGHNLPPIAPVAQRASASRPAVGRT